MVVGTVVASLKDDRLTGHKLLLVADVDPGGTKRDGSEYVAVDRVGAGTGELVVVVSGSPAARALGEPGMPVDAAIVGIVDRVDTAGEAGA